MRGSLSENGPSLGFLEDASPVHAGSEEAEGKGDSDVRGEGRRVPLCIPKPLRSVDLRHDPSGSAFISEPSSIKADALIYIGFYFCFVISIRAQIHSGY